MQINIKGANLFYRKILGIVCNLNPRAREISTSESHGHSFTPLTLLAINQ